MRRIAELLAEGSPFALLHRPEASGPDTVELVAGPCSAVDSIQDLPFHGTAGPPGPDGGPRHEVLALIPYRQIRERGFACPDDGAELLALRVDEQLTLSRSELVAGIADQEVTLADEGFDIGDDAYAALVQRLIDEEIGRGEGANFVLRRSFTARVGEWSAAKALTLFRRLLLGETGSYWTFLVHLGDRTLLGASPERHVSLAGGRAVMNPISGTYRYPRSGAELPQLLRFLGDRKEADELTMVLDEELKMMAAVCGDEVRVVGPYLKEMAHLAHTEYFIEGTTRSDAREVLRRTLFAPTVTGSPLESASRVIERYEPHGRGYYSGVAALLGRSATGEQAMDSAILIRTADIDGDGALSLGVGATVVRHSDPASEAAETRAKAAGLLSAFGAARPSGAAAAGARWLGSAPAVRESLLRRNDVLARYWLDGPAVVEDSGLRLPEGTRILVIDAEDAFTAMLAHQIRAMGAEVTVRRYDARFDLADHDVVVAGPGPGDPRQRSHPKIAALRRTLVELLGQGRPTLAVCLSHQVLSDLLGLPLRRRETPNQGTRRTVDFFGSSVSVGFYNSFAAHSVRDAFLAPGTGAPISVARDRTTGEVHGLAGPALRSFQFHPESVLSTDGLPLLHGVLTALVPSRVATRAGGSEA